MILSPLRYSHSLVLHLIFPFFLFPGIYPFLFSCQIMWNLLPLFFLLCPFSPVETCGSLLLWSPLPWGWDWLVHYLHPGYKWESIWVLALLALVFGGGLIYPLTEFKYLSDRHSLAKWPIPVHLLHLAVALSSQDFTWVSPGLGVN